MDEIITRHRCTPEVPATKHLTTWITQLLDILYPEHTQKRINDKNELINVFEKLKDDLKYILNHTKACPPDCVQERVENFFERIPEIYKLLNQDVKALLGGDPAAHTEFEIIRAYPGFFAVFVYRFAHLLYSLNIPLIPRIWTEYAHSKVGIDIHPGAKIGSSFYIDHGTGVVIGETAVIGNNVKIYQGVTLGAMSIHKDMANTRRHPTVEDDVIIYSGATILGGDTIVGKGSVIGGNVWLTKSIPPYTKVYHHADIRIHESTSITKE
ncbi:MAG: serine acetyltransferase [Saprospiraceae bacterium]|nr:serine acetyltransferase [Saprospiraceae bacterium]